ncbi:8-oxo-dGTP diphosphatase [Bradyrhizobium sp. USDA 3364]
MVRIKVLMGYIGKEYDGQINESPHPAGSELRPTYPACRKSPANTNRLADGAELVNESLLTRCLSMIFSENRFALFRIMLEKGHPCRMADIKLTLVVACALVDADKRVLLAQRPEGKALAGLWEFPGGKIEPGERPEETLIRELHEEIGITVSEPCLAPLTFASHAYETFHLLMPLYICRRWEGMVVPREGQNLAWVRPNKLRDYPMPPADIPLLPHLMDLLL